MWDKILQETITADNKDIWYQLLKQDDTAIFKLKFQEFFLEKCKTWLNIINNFVENNKTWASLMDTKSKLYDTVEGNEDEAMLSAIDVRRYKLFKSIDWDKVQGDIEPNSDNSDDELIDDGIEN